MKRIAFVLCAGADNGGGNTIANQVVKLKSEDYIFDVYCNKVNEYAMMSNNRENRIDKFILFDTYKKLYKMIKDKYYAVFIITQPRKFIKDYVKFIKKIDCIKICFATDRSLRTVKKAIGEYEKYMAEFDCILTFGNEETNVYKYLQTLNENVFEFDFNFYDWAGMRAKKYIDKKDSIIYAGRFANFKGYNKIIENRESLIKQLDNYIFYVIGGAYSFTKKGNLSSTIGILSIICEDIKNKKLKSFLKLNKDYTNFYDVSKGVLNLFPFFEQNDVEDYFFNCTFSLMPTKYKSGKRNQGMFKNAIEYTWLESIKNGTPIICTEEYRKECVIKGKRLIDCDCGLIFIKDFSDIKREIDKYIKFYDKNVQKMQNFFLREYNNEYKLDLIEQLFDKLEREKENV